MSCKAEIGQKSSPEFVIGQACDHSSVVCAVSRRGKQELGVFFPAGTAKGFSQGGVGGDAASKDDAPETLLSEGEHGFSEKHVNHGLLETGGDVCFLLVA